MSSWKDNVRAATTTNLSPFPPTSLLTIDGVALNEGDRVLVKNQADPTQNGIWAAAKSGGWTRTPDANTSALITPDLVVRVSEGQTNLHTEWYLYTPNPIVVGKSPLVFAQSNLLSSNLYGQVNILHTSALADADILSIANFIAEGQSDDPNQYLVASLAGYSLNCAGVHGRNGKGNGQNPPVSAGVWGESDNGFGVYGTSATNAGVWAQSVGDPQLVINHVGHAGNPALILEQDGNRKAGLWWDQTNNLLNLATANTNPALTVQDHGHVGIGTNSPTAPLEVQSAGDPQLVVNHIGSSGNPALWLEQDGTSKAALWWDQTNNLLNLGTAKNNRALTITDKGDIQVTGDFVLLGQDCAEDFDISGVEDVEPGTVMVIDGDGNMQPSAHAYDKRVAGVISGAGDLKPGIILGKQQSEKTRLPLALVGKVYCKVDARYAPVQVGDLLTSSETPGHAMKAADPLNAFGAVIGKALRPLQGGRGLIPILVALQ